jgi:predicted ferric reductase
MFSRKDWLTIIIIASFLPTFLLLDYTVLSQPLGILAIIARFCGIAGTILLLWECVLGVRPIVGRITPDIAWAINWHKKLGKYGFLMILVHPLFITIYFLSTLGINLIHLDVNRIQDVYKDFGFVALCILALIWVTSAVMRKRLSFRVWEKLHLLTYLILPLVIVHNIGLAKKSLPFNSQIFWYLLAIIFLIVVVIQILGALGITEVRYKVVEVKHETTNVTTSILEPVKRYITPKAGQFIYVQYPGHPEAHPFGVSGIDPVTHKIAITAKSLGQFSERLQHLQVGNELIIEGPYGKFTSEVYTTSKPVVLIAGGIGITPFMPTIQALAGGWDKSVTMFYGNQTEAEVAFLPELAQTATINPKFKIIQVITKPTGPVQESGFITCEVMQKHLEHDLENYEFFVCGPPIMIEKLVPELKEYDVPEDQIHFELFSW